MQPRNPSRAHLLAALEQERFDVLVVGGGITGCAIARDAALRGLRVALVEKDDFASGTSSRSSRLIHGGLRYLEHGYLHLVFEASAERRRLLRLAPHLVRPLEFCWPVYSGARVPRWKLKAGLALYDLLSLFRNVAPHRALTAAEIAEREPRLRREHLRGGARYFDAATDDARLTLANALGALEAGAVVVNHTRLDAAVRMGGAVAGALVTDVMSGREIRVSARAIVSAAGPWSDAVRATLSSGGVAPPSVRGSKGVHVAVPRERLGNRGALTLLSPRDGRVMFVLPAGANDAQTIIGTTDTYTTASPDDIRPTRADVQYLLDSANEFFPDAKLVPADVIAAWAGIRPLIMTPDAGAPTSASREHAVSISGDGVVTITGGKLTTYRVMAEDVLRALGPSFSLRRSPTRFQPLPGNENLDVVSEMSKATSLLGDESVARHLVRSFGSRWTQVAQEITGTPDGRERVSDDLPYTMGELRYAARAELATTLGDLLLRRTHLAFETRDHGLSLAERVADAVATTLGWTEENGASALRHYATEVQKVFELDEAGATSMIVASAADF
jgi:glycerol-3-phosphate dehydrogenase